MSNALESIDRSGQYIVLTRPHCFNSRSGLPWAHEARNLESLLSHDAGLRRSRRRRPAPALARAALLAGALLRRHGRRACARVAGDPVRDGRDRAGRRLPHPEAPVRLRLAARGRAPGATVAAPAALRLPDCDALA